MPDISKTRILFDHCPIGLIVVARDRQKLKILYTNSCFHKLSGATGSAETLSELWPGKPGKELVKLLAAPSLPDTMTALFNETWLRLRFQNGNWEGQDAIFIWVNNVSRSSEIGSLQQALADADKAAEIKSNFLATMSHEMRTPMQSVFGLLELIALEKPSANVMDMVTIAKASAVGMLEILDDILDLAKMDAEKMELDMFEVPVRTLTRGVLEALSVKVQGKPIELLDEIGEDVPFVVIGDPKRLRQILINFTGNALKFTETGSVKIKVSTKTKHLPANPTGVNLRFEVIDTGMGMSEDVKARLFQSFTQADNSTARKFGGTGLGLSICKKLVTLMNGQIGVDSKPGEGSVFWFEIPTESIATDANIMEMPDLRGISVLSVEDHPLGAKEIMNSLRSMGATVDSCATYGEALELVKRRPFDVGIIDQGLPDGLGIDLIRDIINIRPFMGLFMYTVRDDPGLQHSLQNLGVKYLAKPASRLGLGQAVIEAVSKSAHFELSGPSRLLIAEDTPSVQDLLKRQLSALGCEADFATNGREAHEALSTGKYGILITDLHMPEMDGYALVQKIRKTETETGKHMPVIVLTADVQMSQRQVYLENGFDECLLKPVSLGHFRRLLIRWGLLKEEECIEIRPSTPIESTLDNAIDMNALIAQMGAFDDDAKEMLGFFVEMTKPLIERLEKAFADNDLKEITEAAHSLKGAARSACANKLGDIAAEIQSDAEEKRINNMTLKQTIEEFFRVESEIQNLMP